MTRPATTPAEIRPAAWYNYVFETDLVCSNGHPPGWHPLYEGKSNDPRRRLLEHAESQPWFPHVTGFRIYPQRYGTEQQALAAEAERIRRNRPLANIQHNEGNPCRLNFGPAPHRPSARRPRRTTTRPRRRPARRRWPAPVRRLVWRAAVWAGLAVALFTVVPDAVTFGSAVRDAVVGASLVMAAGLLGRRRRRWRRR